MNASLVAAISQAWALLMGYGTPALPPTYPVPEEIFAVRPFDWHVEYAPLWEPGSKAFWLEPTPTEYQEWLDRSGRHDVFVSRDVPAIDDTFPNSSMETWSAEDRKRWWSQ